MNLKKKLRKFFTLTRKPNAGFTLVELVVVIAILGVLGGAGTVGYSGYVKNSQKKADMTLVGNIVRAVEVGANSTMFTPPESLAVSATTYPVGFIILGQDGGKVMTSSAEYVDLNQECVFVNAENATFTYLKEVQKARTDCSANTTTTVYEKETKTIYYCITHSKNLPQTLQSNKYVSSYKCEEKDGCNGKEHKDGAKEYIQFADGELGTVNIGNLYAFSRDGKCALAANAGLEGSDNYDATDIAIDDSALADAITAAFGSTANLALQYDKWGEEAEESMNVATFYAYAPEVMTDVKDLGTKMANICFLMNKLNMDPVEKKLLGSTYDSAEEVVNSLADAIATEYGDNEDGWVTVWLGVHDDVWTDGGFGEIQKYGREYYSSVRKAYNSGFAAYLKANGVDETYYSIISDFDRPLSDEYEDILNAMASVSSLFNKPIATDLPSLVNTDTFNNEASGLKKEFYDAGDTSYEAFERCQNLYEKYKLSDACEENARAFLNTMITIQDTAAIAADKEGTGRDYFDYYDTYLNEMANLYNYAQTHAKNGIMIMVTMEQGVIRCSVSPSAADPRNSK